jgi:4-nitrophenyl phosphatase/phosphoglycolate phosphatase
MASASTSHSQLHGTRRLHTPSELLDAVDVFIFDLDGVIWRGDIVVPGAPDVLEHLRALGKRLFFVTNNSTRSRKRNLEKFQRLGLHATQEEILSSSFAAALYLDRAGFKTTGKKVYIVGEAGIAEELDEVGIPHLGGLEDAGKTVTFGHGVKVEHDRDVGAVVVGFDSHINYYKIHYAQLCLNGDPECLFIATNLDAVAHATDAQEWAGGGAMVGAIKGCTHREPIVVGKPSSLLIQHLEEHYSLDRRRICMVGDRLDTDMLFGRENGMVTCLTLSGVTTEEQLLSPHNTIRPDFYVPSIADFFLLN